MEKLTQLTDTHEFRVGLAVGMAIAAALLVIGLITRFSPLQRRCARPVGLAGLAIAGGLVVLFARLDEVRERGDDARGFRLGLVALALGGLVSSARPRLWTGALAAVPGAWVIVDSGFREMKPNIRLAVMLTIVVACPLLASFERRSPVPGLSAALLAVTAFGHYVTVPDTEKARAVVGLTVPIGLVGWPLRLVAVGQAGAYAAVGALAWAATSGGSARTGSVAGACASFGVLVAAPVAWEVTATRFRRAPVDPPEPIPASWITTCGRHPAAVLLTLHAVLVLWGSRVAGLQDRLVPATVLAAPVLALGTLLVAWLVSPAGAPRRLDRSE